MNNKNVGSDFEQRFFRAAAAAGCFIQQMPQGVGYDFLLGFYGQIQPIETKCVTGNRLRLRHFTFIELRIAEEMYERGQKYYVVFPHGEGFGRVPWSQIRHVLLNKQTVFLDELYNKRSIFEQVFAEKSNKI